jgi:glyoxylase-like metal-dependent hydrolase (beta-lactamase superfamily II)
MTDCAPWLGYWRTLVTPFHPLSTGILDDGLFVVRVGVVNMFLYAYGKDHYIAIDSTAGGRGLLRGLLELGVAPSQVTHLFLTHGDADHTGGLRVFANATVYLGCGDAPLVEGEIRRTLGLIKAPRLSRPCLVLADGAKVEVGRARVQAIAAPGHTPGSTCYLVDGRILFAGDLVSLQGKRAVPLSRLFSMDWATQRASARLLAAMPLDGIEWLCTAHSGATRDVQLALASLRAASE